MSVEVVLIAGFLMSLAASVLWGPRRVFFYGYVPLLPFLPPYVVGEWSGLPSLSLIGAVALGIVVVVGFTSLAARGVFPRPALPDVLLLLLLAGMAISELKSFGFTATVKYFITTALAWVLPYALARVFVRSADDLKLLARSMAVGAACLAPLVMFESRMSWNLLHLLFGSDPAVVYQMRWGFQRATGSTMHPIYLGMYYVLALGFAWSAYLSAPRPVRRRWAVVLLLVAGGTVSCLSRGPILAAMLLSGGVAAWQWPRLRPVLASLVIPLLVVVVAVGPGTVAGFLARLAGERPLEIERGQAYYRLHLLTEYHLEMESAGLWGHGMSGLQREVAHRMMWSVDNHYLLFLIWKGWAGLVLFCAFVLSAIWFGFRCAVRNRAIAHAALPVA